MKSASLAMLLMGGILCAVSSLPSHAAPAVRQRVTARIREIHLPADSARFDLPGEWIRPGSTVLMLDSDTLHAGIDYEIETTEGILRLLRPLPAGRLLVRYDVIPFAMGRVFQSPIPPDTGLVVRAPIPPRPLSVDPAGHATRLDIRGSKTVSLEVGNSQDLTVRQSLDLSLSGEITEGVVVRGVLSDRQTPLQAEGRTTELSDLDRIFLEVEGPGASMTLGDFAVRGPLGQFTRYDRQLQGIRLLGRRGKANVGLVAATIPGLFQAMDFLGLEGKQGPYILRPPGSTLDVAMVAGTERVWLDGELLVRGEDRDYLVDYAASTLTFTGRRVINQSSRITVDYQISSQPYRRNAYAAEIGWGAAAQAGTGGFGARLSLIAEHDDEGSPIGGPLTDDEKQILAAAGDSLTDELSSGVDCGSIGSGDYDLVEADSLALPFFLYVGDSLGTCNVRFDDVGEGKGDYVDSTLAPAKVVYRFVGLRRGRYQPGRAVPRPSQRDVLDGHCFYTGPGGTSLEIEGAGSLDDPNTYSDLDDGDRLRGALFLRASRETGPMRVLGRALGRWGLEVESRGVQRGFRALGRIDPGWIGYDWGIASSRIQDGSSQRAARLRHEPGAGFSIEGAYETLSNLRDLDGAKGSLALRRAGRIFGSAELRRVSTHDLATGVSTPGRRQVNATMAGVRLDHLESSLRFRREENETGQGTGRVGSAFDEWRTSAAWNLAANRGRFELGGTFRADQSLVGGVRADADRASTYDARALYTPTGRLLDVHYARRELDPVDGGKLRSDLAGLLWSQDEKSGRFSQQIRADLTTQEQEVRAKSIEYVGPGEGHYDSLGVYVGTGDYDVFLRPTGDQRLERRLDGSYRMEFAPGRGQEKVPTGLASSLAATSQWLLYATTSARTTGSAGRFWNELPDLVVARKDGVPLASFRLRLEASALPQARWASPQVRLERERIRSNDFSNIQSRRARDLSQVTLRSTPSRSWTLEQEIQVDRDIEQTRLEGTGSSFGSSGWRSLRLRLGEWFRPRNGWTARLGLIERVRYRESGGGRYDVAQVVPGIQWVGVRRTRVDLQATRSWVRGPGGQPLGLERDGWEGRGSVSLRLHVLLDANAIWEIQAPTKGARRTTARAELRAVF